MRVKKTLAIVLVCAPGLVLGGCTKTVNGAASAAPVATSTSESSTSSSSSKKSSSSSSTSSKSEPSPSTSASPTTTDASPTTESGSKPSVEAVHAAVVKILTDNGAPQEEASKAADCMAPLMVEQLSAESLNELIAEGEEAIGTSGDTAALNAIISQCVPPQTASAPPT